jgi:signal transduction histidine kinase
MGLLSKDRPQKLKFRLQLIISIVLFIQIVIISTLSLYLFHQHIRRNAHEELTQDLEQTRSSLNAIKQTLYNRMYLLRYSIEDMNESDLNRATLYKKVHTHFTTIKTDRVVMLDADGNSLFSIESRKGEPLPLGRMIESGSFEFVRSEYRLVGQEQRRLYLVTGTKVYHPTGKRYYLFFLNTLDNDFANNLYKQTGINFVLFADEDPVCSVVPDFRLPEEHSSGFNQVKIGSTPYEIKTRLLSSNVSGVLQLTVLRSSLRDTLNMRWLNTIFVVSFLVTLILSLSYIVGVTNRILSPFYELNSWLSNYLKTGETEDLDIPKGGEIEFLTRTFYSMVQRLINEEKIIRRQLHEISFLNKYNTEIMKNLRAGVLILDTEGRIDFSNEYLHTLADVSNGEEVVGMHYRDFFSSYFRPEGEWPDFPQLHFGESRSYLLNVKSEGYSQVKLSLKISYLDEKDERSRVLIVFEDITDTERLWNKILITEKVNSLGLLSAGMAHELNNPLGSIRSHINYLKAVETKEEKRDSVLWLESETNRIENIVKRVLTFSHNNEYDSGATELRATIEEVVEVSRYTMNSKRIRIETDLGDEPVFARIAQNEAKQIFLNLFINATQAIDEEGSLTIRLKSEGEFCHVDFIDTGHGIAEKDLNSIFDPFYSTKSTRDSNGLGLSLVYNILRRVGGDIHIHSKVDKGTRVEVVIPKQREEANEHEYSHSG